MKRLLPQKVFWQELPRKRKKIHTEVRKMLNKEERELTPKPEISYKKCGEYLIPDLEVAPQERLDIGMRGRRHARYLKENKRNTYEEMLVAGTLQQYLKEIGEAADNRHRTIVDQLLQTNPPPSKEVDMMKWVGHMNALKNQAEEIVNAEIIFN